MGDDDGPDYGDLAGLLFGYLVYREIRDGRLDPDPLIRLGCLVGLAVGAVLGGILLLAGLGAPRYDGGSIPYRTLAPVPTGLPAIVIPVTPAPTPRSTPGPTPAATPTARPTPLPGIGTRVALGGGWAVTVTKVQRWRPAWYREPGWRLVTVHVKLRMPAVDFACAWGDGFWLEARSGRTYQGWWDWQDGRAPELSACADYHRPTTAQGWITFEVRDADAKGLVLTTCRPDGPCDAPARIRLR